MEETYKKTRVAIYVRVSTEEQVTKGVSIEHQKESLVEYAKHNNYVLNEDRHIYIDRGFSGASRNRPALEKLMFDSQNNEFDLVIVKKVDRFFRKNLYLLQYVEDLCQNGVGFKAVDQGFNIEDASGKMMLSMLGVIGEMERDLIRDRTISGKIQKAKMGYYVGGGLTRLGYSLEADGKGKKMFVDEEEAKTVKRIFHLYVNEGKTLYEITNLLNNEGVRTKYDLIYRGKENDRRKTSNFWYVSCVSDIIHSEVYIGNYYYGKNGKRFDKAIGKEVSYVKPRSEWVILTCPRIIDDITFFKAQELLHKNKSTKNNKVSHVFAGLIKCDVCGKNYIGYKTSKGTISYRCGGNQLHKTSDDRRCFNKQVSEMYLVEHIWNKIEEVFKNPKEILERYYSSQNQNDILEGYKSEFNDIIKKIEKYSNGLKNLYKDMYLTESDFEKELKQETISTMEKELETLNYRKVELNGHVVRLKRIDENKENLKKIIQSYRNKFKKVSEQNKIELIQEFVEKVVMYENGRLVVFFRFEDNGGGGDDEGNGSNGDKDNSCGTNGTNTFDKGDTVANIRGIGKDAGQVKTFNEVGCSTNAHFQKILLRGNFLVGFVERRSGIFLGCEIEFLRKMVFLGKGT